MVSSNNSNIFVTGTDTDAGKTTVSAWICSRIGGAKYRKLIQTGNDSDSDVVRKFAPNTQILPEVYKLKAPLSAYDAAKIEGIKIDINEFTSKISKETLNHCVFEGAGGIFVPIADDFLMIDAIKITKSHALIVTRSKLGMINHVLLTIEALKNKKIPIVGIVICGNVAENIKQTIEHFSGGVKILAVLPETDDLAKMFANKAIPKEISEILLS